MIRHETPEPISATKMIASLDCGGGSGWLALRSPASLILVPGALTRPAYGVPLIPLVCAFAAFANIWSCCADFDRSRAFSCSASASVMRRPRLMVAAQLPDGFSRRPF